MYRISEEMRKYKNITKKKWMNERERWWFLWGNWTFIKFSSTDDKICFWQFSNKLDICEMKIKFTKRINEWWVLLLNTCHGTNFFIAPCLQSSFCSVSAGCFNDWFLLLTVSLHVSAGVWVSLFSSQNKTVLSSSKLKSILHDLRSELIFTLKAELL